ncbi:hypothetical protein Goklo_015451 [Gossypium klotzschianum]|uniref:40S ribosomal protein S3a n=1 Tax=Gossypium klotzschianum TaxID=34286 RepID=A0A7J8UAU4_9ROSI|nr:hypothetical protein [Gossypium klotzschianum]
MYHIIQDNEKQGFEILPGFTSSLLFSFVANQQGASTMAVGYSFLNLPLLTQMGFASFLESHLFRVVMQEEQEDFQRKEGRKEEGVNIFICVINFSVACRNKLTNMQGMNFTTDKLRFTKRRPNQVKRTCYAQSSQIRQIRRKMREIMTAQATSCDLKELVQKFIPETIGKEIEKATSSMYPLQNVFICQVKILKAPKFDLGKLMEVRGDYSEDVGVKIERPADETMAEPTPELIGA